MMDSGVYKDIVLLQVPRILGLSDRNLNSKTFGCFDRYYWHYKLIDFPNARFQEATLLLALLYKNVFAANIYFEKPKIQELAKAAISFWQKIQNKDGSFNEAYPNERSFVATAFTTYAITESILTLEIEVDTKNIEKAGEWLMREQNFQVANQMAGAVAALHNVYRLTDKLKFEGGAKEKLDMILKLQDKRGFFPEYGGWDIGYLSICIGYLSKYLKREFNADLRDALEKATEFVENELKDDGTYDYTKSSRKTQYLYPHGFMILEKSNVLSKHMSGLKKNRVVNPLWMDDRFSLPLTLDYLQTFLEGDVL